MDVNKLMQKSVSHFETVISKIRAGKATTGILSDIYVNSYNTNVPLEQVANVSTPDARTISIQPWERNMIGAIEKAILASNIGLTPQNDGNYIKLFLPPLTEERRKELVKKVFAEGEEAKIAIRNHRRDCIEDIRKLTLGAKDSTIGKIGRIQEATDKYISIIEKLCKDKEIEIMKL